MIQEKKKSSFQPFLWTLLVLSLLLNGYLWYSKSQISKQSNAQQIQLDEAEQLNAQLESEYYEALADLEEMRSDNEDLNALIDTQKEELTVQKTKISRLISEVGDLKQARIELANLREQVDGYLAEIETLKKENEALVAKNEQLEDSQKSLQEEISQEKLLNDELSTAKAALVSDMEKLSADNDRLTKKVDYASVVNVANISVQGMKTRPNGKEVVKKKAEDVERLEICFEAVENEIADPGIEQFFVRLINPRGETISIENLGSGILYNSETGEPIQYTQLKGIKYENLPVTTCLTWDPSMPFEAGDYVIEVYNKGYKAGDGMFKLK